MIRALWFFLSIAPVAAATALAAPSALVLERKAGHLHYYRGTVLLEGVAERRTDKETTELVGDNLCFVVSAKSHPEVPRGNDERAAWFCFTERDAAIRALKLPSTPTKGSCGYRMPATITVGNYVANRQESEVFDTASLFSVKQRGRLSPIPCG
jgi:hypothetical protein